MKKQTYIPLVALVLMGLSSVSCAQVAAPATFCRFVPERQDDFAWENDKIAFRAYGPAARNKPENSGFDCWLKRVNYPIINKWYAGNPKGKSYHVDHGEGHDPYHVGSTAGCGGTGLWLNGMRYPLEAYTEYEVVECSTDKSVFKLTYECEVDGAVYGEVKTITIELGKRLFNVDSIFTKNGKIAANLPVCIGISTHDGKATTTSDLSAGWIACWEKIKGSDLGTGALMNPELISKIVEVKTKEKDQSHIFLITKTDAKGALAYKAGYGWEKAGEITSSKQWNDYLNNFNK